MSNVLTFKRNQIEQTFVRFVWPHSRSGAAAVVKSNLKRLLDIDKKLDRVDDQPFAFRDVAKAGHGTEIAYTEYQAFALLIGVRLLEGGVPQSRVVSLLRRTRPELERVFATLKRRYRAARRAAATDTNQEQLIRDGFFIGKPRRMRYFVERAGDAAGGDLSEPDADGRTMNLCTFRELKHRLRAFSQTGSAFVGFEISNPLFQLLYWLPLAPVRKRGRQ